MFDGQNILTSWYDFRYSKSRSMNTHGGPPQPCCSCNTFFLFIKLIMMGLSVPRFINFDEGPINKSNVTLELWKLFHQNLLLLNTGTPNLVSNGKIDARWNKYAIIIYCILAPIPYEGIIFSQIMIFNEKMKLNKCCYGANLDGCP
jgi:hypothetical protein